MICSITGIRLAAGTYTVLGDSKYHTTFLSKWNETHAATYRDATADERKRFLKRELWNLIEYCTEDEEIDLGYVKVLASALIGEDAALAATTVVDLYYSIRAICSDSSEIPNGADTLQNYIDVADFLYFCFTVFLQDDFESSVNSINLYGRNTSAAGLLAALLSA